MIIFQIFCHFGLKKGHKNGTKRAYELFPDAFEPRSTSKTSEVKTEKVEKKPVVASAPPKTSKELMDYWKAEQAEKNATALTEKKVEEAKTKSKSAFKREGDSNSDLDLSNIADVGISFATGSRKRRC
ncbi:hypothetical protein H4I96_10721 [Botrytis cinerea]